MIRKTGFALFSLAVSIAALAQEGGHEGGGLSGWLAPIWHVPMIVWQAINLALVITLFYFLLRRRGPEFFRGRASRISEELESARREKEEAQARLKEMEEKMARLGEEIAAIEREAREMAEADRKRVAREAEEMRDRIRREASEEMGRRTVQAKQELRAYTARLAEQTARDLLEGAMTADDKERLMSDFFEKLEERVHG
ncbi:MAG: ATP synthase F0 subunit B [Acidobacteriota bacterium]